MPEFLTLYPPKEALKIWLSALGKNELPNEMIHLTQALGRVTAEKLSAPHALPEFSRSTMDGYAVHAQDTYGANESLPAYLSLVGEIPMGTKPEFELKTGQAALIHTGGMLPDSADAVVQVENTQISRQREIEVLKAVAPAENIIRVGEDVEKGQTVIAAGVRLRPAEIGGLAALGIQHVSVVKQPRIAIISSGDEIVTLETSPLPGQVRDVNTYTLNALIEENGGVPVHYGIVPDNAQALSKIVEQAIRENDAVLISAGSSASARDLTSQVIQKAGDPGVLVHGVNIRPGKPTILAMCSGKPVIGLPGNPVSALVIAMMFVTPMLEHQSGLTYSRPKGPLNARLGVNIASKAGREDWVPVRLLGNTGDFQAEPIFFKSNLIFNLSNADGLLWIPEDITGYLPGDRVEVYPF